MELFIWLAILLVSLVAVVKAAGWLAASAQRIVKNGKRSDFAVASIAAALPELGLALAAVNLGRPELVVPLVIGSSIANILAVVGFLAVAAKELPVKKDNIDLDAPLLAAVAAIFGFVIFDGRVNSLEGLLMATIFFVYTIYVFSRQQRVLTPLDIITPEIINSRGQSLVEVIGSRFDREFYKIKNAGRQNFIKALFLSLASAALLIFAASLAIESLTSVARIVLILPVTLAMTVLAMSAAFPEIFFGLETIKRKRHDVALGNIFASNAVNLLLVCGISALFVPLPVDTVVLAVGLPFLVVSVGLLIVSSFSSRINSGQGLMHLFLYFLFLVKLFGLF